MTRELEKRFRENRKKGLTKAGSCGKIAKLSSERPDGVSGTKKTLKKVEKVLDKPKDLW